MVGHAQTLSLQKGEMKRKKRMSWIPRKPKTQQGKSHQILRLENNPFWLNALWLIPILAEAFPVINNLGMVVKVHLARPPKQRTIVHWCYTQHNSHGFSNPQPRSLTLRTQQSNQHSGFRCNQSTVDCQLPHSVKPIRKSNIFKAFIDL